MFYGSGEDAFFDFSSISKNRRIKYPMLPEKLANKLSNASQVKITPKSNGELRILSADIALMSSKKHNNDATAIFINQMNTTKIGRYVSNIVYADTYEGLRTNEQALVIRKLYEEYDCDYIVLDTNGIRLMPLYIVICNVKRERNGNAEMPTRVEGFIHTQRIGVEIIHPRARAIW